MKLHLLTEEDFEAVWRIMEQSFPPEERRTKEGQRKLFGHPAYRLYGMLACPEKKEELGAFLAVWDFPEFLFLEHFAVDERLRGGGIGAGLLGELFDSCGKSVVLEVEPPEGEMTRRRIGFYERNGFSLNDYSYVQPSLAKGQPAIPLKLMSRPGTLSPQQFADVKRVLLKEVYRCPEGSGQQE